MLERIRRSFVNMTFVRSEVVIESLATATSAHSLLSIAVPSNLARNKQTFEGTEVPYRQAVLLLVAN
jgi:hypothetical protein